MEKIYDESQQQKNQQKQSKKIKIDSVSMLSFAVALFAIVSLVAAGVSGFSFALPSEVVEYPDNFKASEEENIYMSDSATEQDVYYHYFVKENTTQEIPLVCLQRKVPFLFGDQNNYSVVDESISQDIGLLYLLSNLAPNATFTYPDSSDGFTSPGTNEKKYMDFWISQMAVWAYLNGKDDSNTGGVTHVDNVKEARWIIIGDDNANTNKPAYTQRCAESYCYGYKEADKKIFDNVKVNGVSISQLIENAGKKTGIAYSINLSDGEGVVEQDKNKEYYFSPLYTVVPSVDSTMGELTNYSINVIAKDKDGKEVNVGAVVVDEEGNVKTDVSALTLAQLSSFRVRIPSNKIDKNVTVSVTVKGNFRVYDGKRYSVASATDSQEVTAVYFRAAQRSHTKQFDLAPAPDTGISAGQTIYFIGLIVLLCGVGIIYANAKPAKVQAQN